MLLPVSSNTHPTKILSQKVWDGSNRPNESLTTVNFKHLSSIEGVYEAVSSILSHGFCFISESPVSTTHGTKAALEKITKISRVGPWTESAWELTAEHIDKFSDTAFTSHYLGPHTDGSYMLHSPG